MSTTMQDAMSMMFARGKANMTDADLEELADLTEQASVESSRLSAVCEGLGCLIHCDGMDPAGAGNFQGAGDVSTLLFALAHGLDVIAGMALVGGNATFEACRRSPVNTAKEKGSTLFESAPQSKNYTAGSTATDTGHAALAKIEGGGA